MKCPDQVCSAPEICGNVVLVFACQVTDDEILSGEEEEAFICDTPGKVFCAPVPNREGLVRRCDALKWKIGDIAVIYVTMEHLAT